MAPLRASEALYRRASHLKRGEYGVAAPPEHDRDAARWRRRSTRTAKGCAQTRAPREGTEWHGRPRDFRVRVATRPTPALEAVKGGANSARAWRRA